MTRRTQPLFPRSLIVRKTHPPSATDHTVIIRPVVDGTGFVILPTELYAAGFDEIAVTELCRTLRQVNIEAGKAYAAARRTELQRASSKRRHDLLCLLAIISTTVSFLTGYALPEMWSTFTLACAFCLAFLLAIVYTFFVVVARVASPADYTALLRSSVQSALPRFAKTLSPRGWRIEVPADCYWLRIARAVPTSPRGSLNLYN